MIRVHGDVRRINVEPLDHKMVHAMVYDIMNDAQRKHYEDTLECDFSFEIQGLARFRVNAFNQNRGAGAVFRTIPSKILTLEQLNTPKVFAELALKPRGLVLVTGPTGSGKSTTLAAMVNHLNASEYDSPTRIASGSSRSADRSALLKLSVCGPTSRWLTRHFLLSWTNSIGSSTVSTWPYSLSFRWLTIAASVVLLPSARSGRTR